ncbi:MAG: radical SAM protein [Candidatus Methanoperedens sp.]|jgi:uncharacterized radical SAM superfamily protein|nr:radical SAM protein [Candidatus Methanoperedens sp.]PKL53881.1 MAG: hypothetical protein CVV36_04855 [Candidatus Methanoperedenaceae archaeon HGW-Methanoperedenaceae-1]
MTSHEFKKKRVLFINPAKEDTFIVNRIHMGLTLLGEILSVNGHEVLIMDYAFLRSIQGKLEIPNISDLVKDFKPEIIGISCFTYLYDECQCMVDEISQCSNAPIILGGPHITFFPEDFMNDKRVSYLVRGEAESIILDLVNDAKPQPMPVIIKCLHPCAEEIPAINLDIAYGSQYLRTYQIQLSRGCPFSCSFCNIELIAGKKVRARNLELCIEQIVTAKKHYPNINNITITDDCPTFNMKRFKQFLTMFAKTNIDTTLSIDNVRADLIDEEILQLYVKAGGQNVCLGTESGNLQVFSLVNKGESLEEIINAAKLIRKYNLEFGLCFVIGLPEDTLEKHRDSIKLAKYLNVDYAYWNMCTPWPGTKIETWFRQNGEIGDVRNFSTLIDSGVNFKNPPAWSTSFTMDERIKAWLMANLETYTLPIIFWGNLRYLPRNMLKLFKLARQHNLYKSLFIYINGFAFHQIYLTLQNRRRLYLLQKTKTELK